MLSKKVLIINIIKKIYQNSITIIYIADQDLRLHIKFKNI